MNIRRRAGSASAFVVALVMGIPGPAAAVEFEAAPSSEQSWTPNGRVYDILTVRNTVYIGGRFTTLKDPATGDQVPRAGLAAFDRATGALTEWDPGADGPVRTLARGRDGVVFVGGEFTTAGGARNVNLAAIGADGSSLPGFSAWTNGEVRDLARFRGALYVAGRFARVNGVPRVGLARLEGASGELVRAFRPRVGNGRALTVWKARRGLVVGGNFTTVGRRNQRFLALLDPATGARSAWSPEPLCGNCQLLDLVVNSGRVYGAVAGGGGGRVAAWALRTGERLWVRRGDGDVQAIDYHDGRVYAGGHFGPAFDGRQRHQLAVLNTEGRLLRPTIAFTGRDKPGLWAVDAAHDHLRIGGGFQGIRDADVARYAVFPAV